MEPGIVGIFRPVIVWPLQLTDRLSDQQIEAILRHELLHVARRDNLMMALHMAVMAIFWFHPAVWWIERRLIEERERACDEGVMEAGSQAEVYASGILETCRLSLGCPMPCVSGISGADLSRRIRLVMDFSARELSPGARALLLAFGLLAAVVPVAFGVVRVTPFYGQILHRTGPLPSFEVVSIKPWSVHPVPPAPAADGTPPKILKEMPALGDSRQRTNRLHMIMQTSPLIAFAYRIPFGAPGRILGAPSWADDERYEILAKIDDAEFAAMQKMSNAEQSEQVALMEQSLLASRYKLKVHFEIVERPVYELVVAKGGAKLKPAAGIERSRLVNLDSATGSEITATGVTLADFVKFPVLGAGREIVDRTGLAGKYDFTLKWTRESMDAAASSQGGPVSPSLFTAMEEQLGLKLVPAKGPVEVLVIDHIERPSSN